MVAQCSAARRRYRRAVLQTRRQYGKLGFILRGEVLLMNNPQLFKRRHF